MHSLPLAKDHAMRLYSSLNSRADAVSYCRVRIHLSSCEFLRLHDCTLPEPRSDCCPVYHSRNFGAHAVLLVQGGGEDLFVHQVSIVLCGIYTISASGSACCLARSSNLHMSIMIHVKLLVCIFMMRWIERLICSWACRLASRQRDSAVWQKARLLNTMSRYGHLHLKTLSCLLLRQSPLGPPGTIIQGTLLEARLHLRYCGHNS